MASQRILKGVFGVTLLCTLYLVALPGSTVGQFLCEAPVDIMFVIDGSGSIEPGEFTQLRNFAINLSSKFLIAPDAAHVGVVQFGDTAVLDFPLNDDPAAVQSFLQSGLTQVQTNTNIHDGIMVAQEHFADFGRPARAHFLILLTDGEPTRGGDPEVVAKSARSGEEGTFILGVGIGFNSETERAQLASYVTRPPERFALFVTDFDRLVETLEDILGEACIPCPLTCCGHGYCNPTQAPPCVCDAGYTGEECCDVEPDWLVPLAIAATGIVGLLAAALVISNAATAGLGALPVPIEEIEVEEIEAVPVAAAVVTPDLDLDTDLAGMGSPDNLQNRAFAGREFRGAGVGAPAPNKKAANVWGFQGMK